jgi:FkbM family methyltransferase
MQTPTDVRGAIERLQQQLTATQMRLVRAEQQSAALKARLDLQQRGQSPRFDIEFTSQYGEDLAAWRLLGEQHTGFFIEAGAFDGYHYSVTYALEAIGWNGLLVEAIPEAAERCRQRRSASRVVQAALSKRGAAGTTTFNILEDQYGGMLSYLKPTAQHLADTGWAKKRQVTVPLTTLNDLLADHHGPIDLLVLYVVGGELDALDGFDIDRFKPRLMMIEDNSQGRDPGLRNFLSRFPYTRVHRVAVNEVYARNDQTDIIERAKWMQLG